jgi:Tol biopolymer transport system component
LIADRVHQNGSAYAAFSVSDGGDLLYGPGSSQTNGQITWFDRNGKPLGNVGTVGVQRVWLSRDDKTLAIDRYHTTSSASGSDIWLMELPRGVSTRFTFRQKLAARPVWSPDSRRIAFLSVGERSGFIIYEKALNGAPEKPLLTNREDIWPTDWSLDGRFIALQRWDLRTKWDLFILPRDGDQKPAPFLQTEFNETEAAFSPDGHWIAYNSDESGRPEVYVQPFMGALPGIGPKRRISDGGGLWPKWRSDGKELFYMTLDRKLMSVDILPARSIEVGSPRLLFQANCTDLIYSVTRDGQRFLFNVPVKERASEPATLVMNWAARLKP